MFNFMRKLSQRRYSPVTPVQVNGEKLEAVGLSPIIGWSSLVRDLAVSWTTPSHQALCDLKALWGMPDSAPVITVILASDWCICFICRLSFESEHHSSLSVYPWNLEIQAGVWILSASFQSTVSSDSLVWPIPAPRHLVRFTWSAGHGAMKKSLTEMKFGICTPLCWPIKANHVLLFLLLNVKRYGSKKKG